MDARAWRRGFLAGFAALVFSLGGQVIASRSDVQETRCPLSAEPSLAERVIERVKPSVRTHSVAQRVALAVLGAMLHSTCS